MKKADKLSFVEAMRAELQKSPAVVAADYRGLTVAQLSALRGKCRQAGVKIKVAKNTLTKRAAEGTELAAVGEFLKGPTLLAWHHEDPGAAAKALTEFAKLKGNEALKVKGGALGGKAVNAAAVENVLAKLPNREQLLSTLAFMMAGAGAARLHRLMVSGPQKMHRVLSALKAEREKGGPA